jgi:GT2 family glycosyltransferase
MANKVKIARTMERSRFSRSPVTIIIPYYEQYERVTELVKSILRATLSNPYEICLVDDASPNEAFFQKIQRSPQLVAYRSEKRLGFGGALELGFQKTKQPWVVFMNSDCLVERTSWLIEMGRALLELRDQNVRMVSARSDNPGVGVHPLLTGTKEDRVEDNIILKEGFLPLYCAMCHRELFQKIGGFIKNYPLGGYEDEELAYRMRKFGYLQAIAGKSWVHHDGGATFEAICRSDPKAVEILEKNREFCVRDIQKMR